MQADYAATVRILGHVHIEDDSGEVLLDARNAIHPQNMGTMIGRALARDDNYWVNKMVLGNGGASVASGGAITYLPPVISSNPAGLYNKTYEEIVDESLGSVAETNSVTQASGSGVQNVVTIFVELSAEQPASQPSSDQAASIENDFAFDEIGLRSFDDLFLSHVIFSPILKSANRTLTITYTLTIEVQ